MSETDDDSEVSEEEENPEEGDKQLRLKRRDSRGKRSAIITYFSPAELKERQRWRLEMSGCCMRETWGLYDKTIDPLDIRKKMRKKEDVEGLGHDDADGGDCDDDVLIDSHIMVRLQGLEKKYALFRHALELIKEAPSPPFIRLSFPRVLNKLGSHNRLLKVLTARKEQVESQSEIPVRQVSYRQESLRIVNTNFYSPSDVDRISVEVQTDKTTPKTSDEELLDASDFLFTASGTRVFDFELDQPGSDTSVSGINLDRPGSGIKVFGTGSGNTAFDLKLDRPSPGTKVVDTKLARPGSGTTMDHAGSGTAMDHAGSDTNMEQAFSWSSMDKRSSLDEDENAPIRARSNLEISPEALRPPIEVTEEDFSYDDYPLDEMGNPLGKTTGYCHYCGNDILPFPTPYELSLCTNSTLFYCCDEYKDMIQEIRAFENKIQAEVDKKEAKIDISSKGPYDPNKSVFPGFGKPDQEKDTEMASKDEKAGAGTAGENATTAGATKKERDQLLKLPKSGAKDGEKESKEEKDGTGKGGSHADAKRRKEAEKKHGDNAGVVEELHKDKMVDTLDIEWDPFLSLENLREFFFSGPYDVGEDFCYEYPDIVMRQIELYDSVVGKHTRKNSARDKYSTRKKSRESRYSIYDYNRSNTSADVVLRGKTADGRVRVLGYPDSITSGSISCSQLDSSSSVTSEQTQVVQVEGSDSEQCSVSVPSESETSIQHASLQ